MLSIASNGWECLPTLNELCLNPTVFEARLLLTRFTELKLDEHATITNTAALLHTVTTSSGHTPVPMSD